MQSNGSMMMMSRSAVVPFGCSLIQARDSNALAGDNLFRSLSCCCVADCWAVTTRSTEANWPTLWLISRADLQNVSTCQQQRHLQNSYRSDGRKEGTTVPPP